MKENADGRLQSRLQPVVFPYRKFGVAIQENVLHSVQGSSMLEALIGEQSIKVKGIVV